MYCPPRFIIVYGASALSCRLISHVYQMRKIQTYRRGDDTLVDVNFVHCLLASSNQNFMDTFRSECHAAEVFHIILTGTMLDLAQNVMIGILLEMPLGDSLS